MLNLKYTSLLLLAVILSTKIIFAASVQQINGLQYIGAQTEFFVDTSKEFTVETIHEAIPFFQPTNSKVPHFGIFKAPLWLHIQLETTDTNTKWLLNIENTELDSIWYYQPAISNIPLTQGSHYAESYKTINLRNYYFPIQFVNGKADIYMKTVNSVTNLIPIKVGTEKDFFEHSFKAEIYYGLYFGFLFCMFLYNLLLYFRIKDKNYLLYSITIICTLFVFSSISGHLKTYLLPNSPVAASYFLITSAGALITAVSIFMLSALQIRTYLKPLSYVYYGFIVWGLYIVISTPIFGRTLNIVPANAGVGLLSLTIIITSVASYLKGNKYALFFAIAWFAYATGGILMILRNLTIVPVNNITSHAAEVGSALEVVLIAFALGDKYKRYKDEKEHAQKQVIKVQQEANKNLEKQVEERTQELTLANKSLQDFNQKINLQKEAIEQQNKKITDSIHYAHTIQNAMLPFSSTIAKWLPNHSILYLPRDIVSGDFYWFAQVDSKSIIAAVDCTGHGVPGAMMSMLGYNALNTIVKQNGITQPNLILEKLDGIIKQTLKQSETNNSDGMDMALCTIHHDTNLVEYSGANNDLYVIAQNSLQTIKASKRAIGGSSDYNTPFELHTLPFNNEHHYYLFSDGYADQFGGEKGKKFMSKKFKETLLNLVHLPAQKQAEALKETITSWMGNHEQVDDILVINFTK